MIIVELLNPTWVHPWYGVFQDMRAETLNQNIVDAVKKEERPPISISNDSSEQLKDVIALMKSCWSHSVADRPTAASLESLLVDQV